MQQHHSRAARVLMTSFIMAMLATGCDRQASESAAQAADDDVAGTDVTGRVTTCHDGDTCVIKLDGGLGNLKVRLIGIDAPEVSGGDDNQGQPLGKQAKTLLNDLVKGKDVRVRAISRDKYERMLSEIYVGDTLANMEMLKEGLAEAYIWSDSPIEASAYRNAQKTAKEAALGVWSLDDYERPQDFRARTQADE